jgi:protein-disulfide isomerase
MKSRPLAPLLLGLALSGCMRPTEAKESEQAASTPTRSAVVAQLGDTAITLEQVDARVGTAQLMPLREKEYELRRRALDQLLEEKLFAQEARAQGVSVEQLLAKEVDAKAAEPPAERLERLYEEYKRSYPTVPKEQLVAQIRAQLVARAQKTQRSAYRRQLVAKSGIRVNLEPPRSVVTVPDDAPALGPSRAPVTIVEFADYQCPYCRRAQETVEEVLKLYPGKIRLVHRDFPLDGHPRAVPASKAAQCAQEQGKFWEYHRELLSGSGDMSDADLKRRAELLKLNVTTFSSCLASGATEAKIQASLQDGTRIGVTGTPAFFINGRRVDGARDLSVFQEIIDEELERVR